MKRIHRRQAMDEQLDKDIQGHFRRFIEEFWLNKNSYNSKHAVIESRCSATVPYAHFSIHSGIIESGQSLTSTMTRRVHKICQHRCRQKQVACYILIFSVLFPFWSAVCSVCSGLAAECWTRNRQGAGSNLTWSTAGNIEQVANLLCAQAQLSLLPSARWEISSNLPGVGYSVKA